MFKYKSKKLLDRKLGIFIESIKDRMHKKQNPVYYR